jgi:ArsR family transcriptional regulator, lead/cadmium/zinc/bismuth-responsive transcriptional repressor
MHENELAGPGAATRTPAHTPAGAAARTPPAPEPDRCDAPCFDADVVRRIRVRQPDPRRLDALAETLGLLGERNRLLVLHALQDGQELCVCDVAHVLGTSVAGASHHLRKLRAAGFVTSRRDGKLVVYSLAPAGRGHLPATLMKELRLG